MSVSDMAAEASGTCLSSHRSRRVGGCIVFASTPSVARSTAIALTSSSLPREVRRHPTRCRAGARWSKPLAVSIAVAQGMVRFPRQRHPEARSEATPGPPPVASTVAARDHGSPSNDTTGTNETRAITRVEQTTEDRAGSKRLQRRTAPQTDREERPEAEPSP
jgi:hypothetical protein